MELVTAFSIYAFSFSSSGLQIKIDRIQTVDEKEDYDKL